MPRSMPCDVPGATITNTKLDEVDEGWRKDRRQCDWYCEACESGYYDQELDHGLVCPICNTDLVSG